MTPLRRETLLSACLFLIVIALPFSLIAQNVHSHSPKIVIDDGSHMTPFAKGLNQNIGDKVKKNCGADHNPKKNERALAAWCGVPAVDLTNSSTNDCPDCGATDMTDNNGRSTHQLKNKVSLRYDNPSQRGIPAW